MLPEIFKLKLIKLEAVSIHFKYLKHKLCKNNCEVYSSYNNDDMISIDFCCFYSALCLSLHSQRTGVCGGGRV